MPVYEYIHPGTGAQLLAVRAVPNRDEPPVPGYVRRTVPSRITIGTGAPQPTVNDNLRRAYYQLEHAGKLRDNGRHLRTGAVKRALDHTPPPPRWEDTPMGRAEAEGADT